MTKNVNHNFFGVYTFKSCYWAGFLAADGNISKKTNAIQLCLGTKDLDHLIQYKNDISSKHAIVKDNNCYRLSFYSNKIKEDLCANFNVIPDKTFCLEFPLIPKIFQPYFILGYFDGDGHISKYKSSSQIKGKTYTYDKTEVGFTGNDNFIRDLYDTLSISGSVRKKGKVSTLKFSSKDSISKIFNFLYKDTDVLNYCLLRKYNKFLTT